MKILKYIPHIIALILVIVLGLGYLQYTNLQEEAIKYRNEAISLSELYTNVQGVASKRALEIAGLQASNDALNNSIKDNKETIRSLTALNGILSDSLANVSTTTDTIYVDSVSMPIRRFNVSEGGFTLKGYFQVKTPYEISFEKMMAEVKLEIAITEGHDGIWSSNIYSPNPNFSTTDINTSVNPYTPTFKDKLKFNLGAYGGTDRIGVLAGVGYDKHALLLGFDTQGAHIGYMRSFGVK